MGTSRPIVQHFIFFSWHHVIELYSFCHIETHKSQWTFSKYFKYIVIIPIRDAQPFKYSAQTERFDWEELYWLCISQTLKTKTFYLFNERQKNKKKTPLERLLCGTERIKIFSIQQQQQKKNVVRYIYLVAFFNLDGFEFSLWLKTTFVARTHCGCMLSARWWLVAACRIRDVTVLNRATCSTARHTANVLAHLFMFLFPFPVILAVRTHCVHVVLNKCYNKFTCLFVASVYCPSPIPETIVCICACSGVVLIECLPLSFEMTDRMLEIQLVGRCCFMRFGVPSIGSCCSPHSTQLIRQRFGLYVFYTYICDLSQRIVEYYFYSIVYLCTWTISNCWLVANERMVGNIIIHFY